MAGPKDYFAQRTDEPLTGPDKVAALVQQLADLGAEADKLLTRAELAKATSTRDEERHFEQLVQTLGALSREAWAAHASIIRVSGIYHQLDEVERAVAANLAP